MTTRNRSIKAGLVFAMQVSGLPAVQPARLAVRQRDVDERVDQLVQRRGRVGS